MNTDLPKKKEKGKEEEEESRPGRRYMLVNDISPSPEAACESQSKGLSDCTLHAN